MQILTNVGAIYLVIAETTSDWQLAIEKVEWGLEGWQAKVLSRGGRLVLLQLVLSLIPIFYLSFFKLPLGVRKHLDGLMMRFTGKGSRLGERIGTALVSRDVVCWPIFMGGLGLLQLQAMNVAQQRKWVYRLMSPEVDLTTQVLNDNYSPWMDQQRGMALVSGASAFLAGAEGGVSSCLSTLQCQAWRRVAVPLLAG